MSERILKGRVVGLLEIPQRLPSQLPPILLEDATGCKLAVAHQPTLRAVEESLGSFFDEMSVAALTTVEVELEGVTTEERSFDGATYRTVTDVRKANGKDVHDPGSPEADERHRYLEVPLSYDQPDLGTFKLYYELSSDFDPRKRTVLIPADPQQTSSWVGAADRNKGFFGVDLNVVVFQYRGAFASPVSGLEGAQGYDWRKAYTILNARAAVEDMERIRIDLLGEDGRLFLAGGSGLATMGLLYLQKYHSHVDRALLMSFYVDAEVGSRATDAFFQGFLEETGLRETFHSVLAIEGVEQAQLYHLLQRLLYSSQERARELLERTAAGDLTVYREETATHGRVDYFVRSVHRYWPQVAVFMYETNVPAKRGVPDINSPFLDMGEPIARLVREGELNGGFMKAGGLDRISTEVLLVAGTKDQVTPVEVTAQIHRSLPNSRLAVFDAYHCLATENDRRGRLINTFFAAGSRSQELDELLRSDEFEGFFLELRD